MQNYDHADPKTYDSLDYTKVTNKQVFDYFGLVRPERAPLTRKA